MQQLVGSVRDIGQISANKMGSYPVSTQTTATMACLSEWLRTNEHGHRRINRSMKMLSRVVHAEILGC